MLKANGIFPVDFTLYQAELPPMSLKFENGEGRCSRRVVLKNPPDSNWGPSIPPTHYKSCTVFQKPTDSNWGPRPFHPVYLQKIKGGHSDDTLLLPVPMFIVILQTVNLIILLH